MTVLQGMRRSDKKYLELRELNPDSLSSDFRAARFIYLNRFCFNGLYRTNQKGKFNVPYGGERSGQLPSKKLLEECSQALRTAKLIAGDFEKVLMQVTNGDFIYMDPPFSVESRRVFKEYSASTFNEEDLKRLRHWMEFLANKNIDFLVSYAECEEADFLKKGFHTAKVSVRRNIAGFAQNRTKCNELLISLHPPGQN
jgi:DNA adenine methylase